MTIKDLTDVNALQFDIYASRTGANIKVGLFNSNGTVTEKTPTVGFADSWETVDWDISGVSNADKDSIEKIIVTIVNDDVVNTFYLDNFISVDPVTGAVNSIFFGTDF